MDIFQTYGWKIVGTIDSDIKNAYDGYALLSGLTENAYCTRQLSMVGDNP
jgi:hypothetical protein